MEWADGILRLFELVSNIWDLSAIQALFELSHNKKVELLKPVFIAAYSDLLVWRLFSFFHIFNFSIYHRTFFYLV